MDEETEIPEKRFGFGGISISSLFSVFSGSFLKFVSEISDFFAEFFRKGLSANSQLFLAPGVCSTIVARGLSRALCSKFSMHNAQWRILVYTVQTTVRQYPVPVPRGSTVRSKNAKQRF